MSFRDKESFGHVDLESTELLIRSSMHSLGSIILEEILNSDKGGHQGKVVLKENGISAAFKEYRNKRLQTVLGNVVVKRAYYYDQELKTGYCPKDQDLDIEGTSLSPGLRRIVASGLRGYP